jgi:segregation and condensation protein A
MEEVKEGAKSPTDRIGQDEVYNLLTSNEVSWQSIIYDLINTEQLNPWDVDLSFLSKKYLEKIKELEEANFFVSSKVLLAASILLRLKSDILLHHYLRSIDEVLFGKKEESKPVERLEIDESELPLLYPKTPLPRHRKVSLKELMTALEKAISTESRRIKKEVVRVQQVRDADIVLPKARISVRDRIRKIYSKILTAFKRKRAKISYNELTGNKKEDRIACFLPCLHLENQQKLFLEQENHFEEIWVWLYKHYKKQQEAIIDTQLAIDEKKEEIAEETGFDNPLANFFDSASEIMKTDLS